MANTDTDCEPVVNPRYQLKTALGYGHAVTPHRAFMAHFKANISTTAAL
jgi:hypothetical protein